MLKLQPWNPEDFDIDVDVSTLLDDLDGATLIDDRWYRLAHGDGIKDPRLRKKGERMLDNSLWRAQWVARSRRKLDRRRAVRAPLISRVFLGRGDHLVSTDISLSGMRCSGEPQAPLMEVEFKLPGLAFPVDARVEVISYKECRVLPWVGLRFINLQRPYAEQIARYIASRRQRLLAA